jgi:RND family efflux transporter MFP subunit
MEADLEKSRIQHQIAKLNLDMADYKADIEKKKIELQLKNAAIDLDRVKEKIAKQKNINQQVLSKLALRANQAETKLEEALSTMERLTIKAPGPGISIIERNWSTDNKFQVDDQPWRGQYLIRLPDLSTMQAKVMVSEVDISKIKLDQTVKIRMDAYPDSSFNGKVVDVATLARNKDRESKVKIFDVTILIDGDDQKLMPGMTVSCEVLINKIPDTLFVPLEAVFKNDQGPFVYLKNGSDFDVRQISTGQESDDYVLIDEGLEENDEISLMDLKQLSLAAPEKEEE